VLGTDLFSDVSPVVVGADAADSCEDGGLVEMCVGRSSDSHLDLGWK
jgi:hypothetical protein